MGEIKTNPNGTHTITGGFSSKNKDDTALVAKTLFKEVPKSIESKVEEPKYEPIKPIIPDKVRHTEKELIALNKAGQIDLLKKLGAKNIPNLEKDRVALILKLEE